MVNNNNSKPSVLFISPGHEPKEQAEARYRSVPRDPPPYFALRLGAYVKQFGTEVDVLDTHADIEWEAELRRMLAEKEYTVVGFTVYLGLFLRNAKDISEIVREVQPGAKIVWGGPVASSTPDQALENYQVDYCVRFEGEETLQELLDYLHGGETGDLAVIDGLSYLVDGALKNNAPRRFAKDGLSNYPIPDWSLLGDKINKEQSPCYAFLMSSAGCPYKCNFCYHQNSDFKGSAPWRSRSVDHVMQEVDMLHDKYGITVFSFGDDNFMVNKKRVLKVFDEFRKRGFFIEEMVGHFGNFNDEVIENMEGLVGRTSFSIEAATPHLLDLVNKRVVLDKVPEVVGKIWDAGVLFDTIFIVGLPTETKADLRSIFEIMYEVRWRHPAAMASSCFLMPILETGIVPLIEKTYNVTLPKDIKTFEEFNEVPLCKEAFEKLKVFHPHLEEDRFDLLAGFQVIFRDIFRYNKLSKQSFALLATNEDLAEIFEGYKVIPRAKDGYEHYLLNWVLEGKDVDFKKSLHSNVVWPKEKNLFEYTVPESSYTAEYVEFLKTGEQSVGQIGD